MTMTREEAEAKGWDRREFNGAGRWFKPVPYGSLTICNADDEASLAAIAAIERYADAEKMLEECKTVLEEYFYGRTFKADVKAILAKLEARNGT